MRDLPDLDEHHKLVKLPGPGKPVFVIHVEYEGEDGWLSIPFAFDGPEHWRQWHMRNARELFTTVEVADEFAATLEKMGPLGDE